MRSRRPSFLREGIKSLSYFAAFGILQLLAFCSFGILQFWHGQLLQLLQLLAFRRQDLAPAMFRLTPTTSAIPPTTPNSMGYAVIRQER